MKIALVIPIYNRPQYVRECFESLDRLTVKPDMIFVVDDASTVDMPVLSLKHTKITNKTNQGVKVSLMKGVDTAFGFDAELIINLDSDAVVKPDFVERLVELWDKTKMICSGFNNPKEPEVHKTSFSESWVVKAHANGINMCFNREQYEQHIKPALLSKNDNWDYMASESAGRVAITVPSCVQHIGLKSSMGHVGADVAHDFKQLSLPNVTLFGIDSHDVAGIMRAAEISFRDIEFGDVNIITDDLFTKGGTNEQRREDYSKFIIKELTKHFTTSHVLTIHADGYVLNWRAWDNDWLQYDYIGAPWNWYKECQVGNGGFSLRSKKLCDILAEYELGGGKYHPEDDIICRTYRPALEKLGIKFAPVEVAKKFSIEGYGIVSDLNVYAGEFGFHAPHVNLSTCEHYGVPIENIYRKGQKSEQKQIVVPKRNVPLRR